MNGIRILLAEDNDLNAEIAMVQLEELGMTVTRVNNGKIRGMQNRPEAGMIPIIAMTANAFAEDVQASLDAGMNGHLSKPIVIAEVVKTIARNVSADNRADFK
ncbi:MAG: response regulator [Lachnospiraceae bacterium]|nr:response regulator [Lachnospiraceae bacterium]